VADPFLRKAHGPFGLEQAFSSANRLKTQTRPERDHVPFFCGISHICVVQCIYAKKIEKEEKTCLQLQFNKRKNNKKDAVSTTPFFLFPQPFPDNALAEEQGRAIRTPSNLFEKGRRGSRSGELISSCRLRATRDNCLNHQGSSS